MRRNVVCMALGVISLVLAACGSAGATPTIAGTGDATASAGSMEPMQGELSTAARDMLGIFKLEGTDLAVDAEQAGVLLPLWQAYRSLLNSDTTASAELEALKSQIDGALTSDQHDAIAAMNLTAQDLFTMAEELGVTQAPPSADGTETEGNRPSFAFGGGGQGGAGAGQPPSGGGVPPAGGGARQAPPGGGEGFMIQGEGIPEGFDPSMLLQGTPQPGRAAMGRQGDRFSLMLLDPLIELLKERAGS